MVDIDGTSVFVKRIPLTDLERAPGNAMSTADLFELPTTCHYGVVRLPAGGFGAWRELAANTATTSWVLDGRTEAFPLMHHWRVLPGGVPPAEELADVERVVAYWNGSAAVRHRLRALARASASLVLFLEHVPSTLAGWLAERRAAGPDAVAAACLRVDRLLRADVADMNGRGLLHFDAHARNVLTDGRSLYLADLGQALWAGFDLSAEERDFLVLNVDHDAAYVARELVNWIVAHVVGIPGPKVGGPVERYDYVRRCAAGSRPTGVPEPIADLVMRAAPVVSVLNDFCWRFFESPVTPYPAAEIARALVDARA